MAVGGEVRWLVPGVGASTVVRTEAVWAPWVVADVGGVGGAGLERGGVSWGGAVSGCMVGFEQFVAWRNGGGSFGVDGVDITLFCCGSSGGFLLGVLDGGALWAVVEERDVWPCGVERSGGGCL